MKRLTEKEWMELRGQRLRSDAADLPHAIKASIELAARSMKLA